MLSPAGELNRRELEAFLRASSRYPRLEDVTDDDARNAAAAFVNARRVQAAKGDPVERVTARDVGDLLDKLMARVAAQEERGRDGVTFAARQDGDVDAQSVQRFAGAGMPAGDPLAQHRLSLEPVVGPAQDRREIDRWLLGLGFAADRAGPRNGLLAALTTAPAALRSELFAHAARLRRRDAKGLVYRLMHQVLRRPEDAAKLVREAIDRPVGLAEPRWLRLAADPACEPELSHRLDADLEAIAGRNGSGAALRHAVLEQLRQLDLDLMGEVLARMDLWPPEQRHRVLTRLAKVAAAGAPPLGERVDLWLRGQLDIPPAILVFDAATGGANTDGRAVRKNDARIVDAALGVMTLSAQQLGAGRAQLALEILAGSTLPDARIDDALRAKLTPQVPADDTIKWLAELGLLRRGNFESCRAMVRSLGEDNPLLVRSLAELHADTDLSGMLAGSLAPLRHRLAALAKAGSDNVDAFIARVLRDRAVPRRERAAFAKLVLDFGLRGPGIDAAMDVHPTAARVTP